MSEGWGNPQPGHGSELPGSGPVADRLQSLLSRAVDDQMAEQHEVSGALADVRAELARLAQRAGQLDVRAELDRLRAEVAGTAQAGERVGRLDQRLAGVDDQLASISAQLEDITGGLELLGGLPRQFAALAEQVTTTAEQVGVVSAVAQDVGGLRSELTAVRGQLGDQPGTGGAVGGAVGSMIEQAIADSERRLTAHVDEAVLALAEALLRRRSRGSGRLGAGAYFADASDALDVSVASSASSASAASADDPLSGALPASSGDHGLGIEDSAAWQHTESVGAAPARTVGGGLADYAPTEPALGDEPARPEGTDPGMSSAGPTGQEGSSAGRAEPTGNSSSPGTRAWPQPRPGDETGGREPDAQDQDDSRRGWWRGRR